MFFSFLNYIASQSIALPTHGVNKKEAKKETNNDGTLIWVKHGSNIIYTDIESGLIKYDSFDILVKGM